MREDSRSEFRQGAGASATDTSVVAGQVDTRGVAWTALRNLQDRFCHRKESLDGRKTVDGGVLVAADDVPTTPGEKDEPNRVLRHWKLHRLRGHGSYEFF